MNLERYEIRQEAPQSNVFGFTSEGPKGRIAKAVVFTRFESSAFYNLGFGDINEETNELDDIIVTDNGDTQLILATVAAIVIQFTAERPEAKIYATGSTAARTRLYRIGITTHLPDMAAMFRIFGFRDEGWHPFEKGIEYEAFYVERKS